MIKLSKTSKLDGIMSWSLNALDTCQGSIGKDGNLVPACQGCYATTGNYRFPNVKAPREFNKQDWKRDTWVSDMVIALDSSRYFRFFDSGDMYSIDLAEKILELCSRATWCKFWIPTRMHKFKKFEAVLSKLQALPNVVVRFSSDEIDGTKVNGSTTSVIFSDELQLKGDEFICKAYEHEGKCNGCRACYSKDVSVIAYKAHGVKMAKVIKIMSVKG
jgi:predicted metal-binding protein